MNFLDKVFGRKEPLAPLRKALDQRRWADALAIGESLAVKTLDAGSAAERDRLLEAAGDALAELNLLEGEGCLRGGDREKAAEHFGLAASQVRSDRLARRIGEVRKQLEGAAMDSPSPAPSAACASGCCGESSRSAPNGEPPEDPEEEVRLELILSSYPAEWAQACLAGGELFRKAFLQAHAGDGQKAVKLFECVPIAERGGLFHFEYGAVLARLGQSAAACRELEAALAQNPGNALVLETLLTLEIAEGKESSAILRLEKALNDGDDPGFCHGWLARIRARLGDMGTALPEGLQALAAGNSDPQVILLTANLLEREGRTGEAEAILKRLPASGGCAGGVNIPLAEFWLRQGKNLDKSLEAFKGALRQGMDSPRWALRIAQTYLAKGWKREGLPLLKNALADPDLPAELHREGSALLNEFGEHRPGSP